MTLTMSKLSIICLLLFTICVVKGLSSAESAQNGSEPVEHQIPEQTVGCWNTTKFQYTVFGLEWLHSNSTTFCTGTFIAPNAILTAAHCCDQSSNVRIYLQNLPQNLMNEVNILSYHLNPAYISGLSNDDIAIIELTDSIEWARPATVDYSGVKHGETVWMYGFGQTEPNRTRQTVELKEWSAKVDSCNDNYYNIYYNEMIFTYGQNGSVCKGGADSGGGPMFNLNGTLVGLHSGSSTCFTSAFNLAVRISSHKHFIQKVLSQNIAFCTLYLNSALFSILITFASIFTFITYL